MAASTSSAFMPLPLSTTARQGISLARSQNMRISVASAEMLLSIRSAIAASREYPKSRNDADKLAALGARLYGVAISGHPRAVIDHQQHKNPSSAQIKKQE